MSRPPVAGLLHETVADRAAQTPRATAVVDGSTMVTYADLEAAGNRLAHRLLARGVEPEQRIGVLLDRSADLVVAILAVFKAGCAYVPLDPTHPDARLATTSVDAAARVILTHDRHAGRLGAADVELIRLDTDRRETDRFPATPPSVVVDAGQLAYVLYTSGSTGAPKGVAVQHRSLAANAASICALLGVRPGDAVAALSAVGFDISLFELLAPLTIGARVVMAQRNELIDGGLLATRLRASGVTVAQATPSSWRVLIEAPDLDLTGLRVICAGEALTGALADTLADRGARVWNLYGPTETTIYSTGHRVEARGLDQVPIGGSVAGSELYILDDDLRPVPDGETGELYIGGGGLARGYLGRAGLTADRFVPAVAAPPGQRLYRTGDRVRRLPDGCLRYVGRADSQVKVRGVRVEPAETEAVLARHPAVSQAVVAVRSNGDNVAGLVAYVRPADPAASHAALCDVLRGHLVDHLPAPMVPSAFVVLDEFPLTPNGKVDRRALPAPPAAGPADGGEATTPGEFAGGWLAGVWADVLGVSRVDPSDSFIDLGGDSLRAGQVVARARARHGVTIPIEAMLDGTPLSAFAPLVGQTRAAAPAGITPRPVPTEPIPISPAQRRLWLLAQLDPASPTYHVPILLGLDGPVCVPAVRSALHQLVSRHDALRIRFDLDAVDPVQRVVPAVDVELAEVDLRGRPAPGAGAGSIAESAIRRPFDLGVPPLLRATLMRLDDEAYRLLVVVHHIVFDGWSVRTFLREFGDAYAATVQARQWCPDPLAIGYADVARWQADRLQRGALDEQVDYWRRRFASLPSTLHTLADNQCNDQAEPTAGRVTQIIDGAASAPVREFGRAHGSTLFVTMLAAFATLLHRLTGETDIVVGAPLAGRTDVATEDLIGFFVNTVPLRLDFSGPAAFETILRRTRRAVLEAHANQDVPYDLIISEVAPARAPGRNPLFQCWFNLLGPPDEPPVLPDVRAEVLDAPTGGALFDLNTYVTELPDTLRVDLVYDDRRFSARRAAILLEQFVALLLQLVERPDLPVSAHTLVTAGTRDVLPDPRRPLGVTAGTPLLAGLGRAARQHADRVAVRSSAGGLTYATLAQRADRLAAGLRASGVGPGRTAAILASRTADLVPAMLGVLRAGAAFLVLDPAYPSQRLAELVAAARPDALLCLEPTPVAHLLGEHRPEVLTVADLSTGDRALPYAEDAGRPQDLAYVAFTSGSTGPRPLGVLGEHAPLAHFLDWYARRFDLHAEDRVSVLSGLAHDPLLRDVFAPLWVGATACVPDAAMLTSPRDLLGWLNREQITVTHLTPQLGRLLAVAHEVSGEMVPSLRLACFGGDRLTHADADALHRLAPQATVVNCYGATETPQVMAYHVVGPGYDDRVDRRRSGVPLGIGIDDVQLLVSLPNGDMAGIGEPGEIVVRTRHLTRGYLDAGRTAARFRPDADPGVRRFLTGDLGRFLVDGGIEFLGRADRQVKVRGFRVDPAEIEAVCRGHRDVVDAAVVARPDRSGGLGMVAYVVFGRTSALSDGDFPRYLADALPSHMRPWAVVPVDALPLTPNGKLDVGALTDPLLVGGKGDSRGRRPPLDELERQVAAVWREVLGVDTVDVDENFFDLGGNSILMIRLQAMLQSTLGLEVAIVALFQHPTVRSLCRHLRGDDAVAPLRVRRPTARTTADVRARRTAVRAAMSSHRSDVVIRGSREHGSQSMD